MNTYESLKFCDGAQNKKDIKNWQTLHEFDKTVENKSFDVRVYKQNNRVVLAFSGANISQIKDDKDSLKILYSNKIPKQYLDAENLYNLVKSKYPNSQIELTGYSLGGTISNLLAHHTGLSSIAIAPIGSKHIVEANSKHFTYSDEKIKTYGRKSDNLFNKMIDKQSGSVYIVSDLEIKSNIKNNNLMSIAKYGNKLKFEPHLLHNFSNKSLEEAKLYKNATNLGVNRTKTINKSVPSTKTKPETTKNFSEILRQKYKSIKSINNKNLSKIFKNTIQKTGNEHWVTINGNHVLINS